MKQMMKKVDRQENNLRRLGIVIRKYSFPHRTVDIWNELAEEIVKTTNIHKFKEILDKWRNGDRKL